MSHELDASVDQLVAEFRKVMASAESLLHAAAAEPEPQAQATRGRIQDTLRDAREQLERAEATVTEQARAAFTATDHLVRRHPWESVAVAAAVGLIAGLLASRR